MFLVNSRLSLFSAATNAFRASLITSEAPLLPKLRGHFAEFLNDSCLERLGAFTPVHQCRFAVRTLLILINGAFLGSIEWAPFREVSLTVLPSLSRQDILTSHLKPTDRNTSCPVDMRRLSSCVPPKTQTDRQWGWSFDQLSIGFAFRLYLRPA